MSDPIVGIDLGSENMKLAGMVSSTQILRWENLEGDYEIPVYFNSETKVIGRLAKSATNGKSIHGLKHYLDQSSSFFKDLKKLGFIKHELSEEEAKKVVATTLATVNAISDNKTKKAPAHSVITYPTYFTEKQQKALLEAAKIAKLKDPNIFSDVTSIAYYTAIKEDLKNETFVVINVGQTLSATVLEMKNRNNFIVGNTYLYHIFVGKMLEKQLYDYAINKFFQDGKHLLKDVVQQKLDELKEKCYEASKTLIKSKSFNITVPRFIGDDNLNVKVKQDDLAVAADVIVEMINDMLDEIEDVDDAKIILTGYTSSHGFIKEIIESRYDSENVYYEEKGDTSLGAVYIARDSKNVREKINGDVIALQPKIKIKLESSIGIDDSVNGFIPVIEAGADLPSQHSIVLKTTKDDQSSFIVCIYAGMSKNVKDNAFVDMIMIPNIPKKKKGEVCISLRFKINESGFLHVEAKSQDGSIIKKISTKSSVNMSYDDIEKCKVQNEANIERMKATNLYTSYIENLNRMIVELSKKGINTKQLTIIEKRFSVVPSKTSEIVDKLNSLREKMESVSLV